MKNNFLTWIIVWLAAWTLTACYDYGELTDARQKDILLHFDDYGKALLNLEIPLDIPNSTRATIFDDGDDQEHVVNSILVVLFHGTGSDEDAFEVASVYNVLSWDTEAGSTQVTKQIQITSDNIKGNDNIYLLAILNATPVINVGMSFAEVKQIMTGLTSTVENTDYFIMTNSPLAYDNSGTMEVSTLKYIDPDCFFETEDEAADHPAAQIYVERLAAKVSVELGDIPTRSNSLPEGNQVSYTDYYVKGNPNLVFADQHLADYSLYNYNTQSYLVRHFTDGWQSLHRDGTTDYRFVEPQPLPYSTTSLYRTYWAEDANYDEDMYSDIDDAEDDIFKSWKDIKTKASGSTGESDYCAENTMDLAHMNIRNSTLVLVRLNLNNYTSFYTTSVTGSDVIYQLPTNPNAEEGTTASSTFARQQAEGSTMRRTSTPTSDQHYYVSSARTIDEYLREWLMQTNANARQWVETYAAGNANHIKIDLTNSDGSRNCGPADGGQAVVHCTQTARTAGTTGADAFSALNLDTYFAQNITVNFYDDGYCYYLVPIMHFGDTQAPWQSAATMTGGTASAAYGTDNAAYLGRYGVVRNNWYTITITGVNHVGACNSWQLFNQTANQADDTVEQLLNATLVISPWESNSSTLVIPSTP